MHQYALRDLIHARILAGELPSRHEHQLSEGRGNGSRCTCCNQSINPEQVLYEVTVPPAYGEPAPLSMHVLHVACYSVWRAECAPPLALAC
jgi:hypothetical protein